MLRSFSPAPASIVAKPSRLETVMRPFKSVVDVWGSKKKKTKSFEEPVGSTMLAEWGPVER